MDPILCQGSLNCNNKSNLFANSNFQGRMSLLCFDYLLEQSILTQNVILISLLDRELILVLNGIHRFVAMRQWQPSYRNMLIVNSFIFNSFYTMASSAKNGCFSGGLWPKPNYDVTLNVRKEHFNC